MLEIDLPLLLITAVVFIGLIVILNFMVYKPLLSFIDKRNESIKLDEDSASKNSSDISVYNSESEKIISEAKLEANKIRQSAIDTIKSNISKEVESKKKALEEEYSIFLQNLSEEKQEFKAGLLSSLPEIKNALKTTLSKI